MLAADIFGIPLVLWSRNDAAAGHDSSHRSGTAWIYVAALFDRHPGLRAHGSVPRRHPLSRTEGDSRGPVRRHDFGRAAVGDRVALAAARDSRIGALPIYWAFALIYVGGSRFIVRGLLNFRWSNGTQRVVIYGAGAAGVQLATGLDAQRPLSPGRLHRRQHTLQGSTINGLEVFPLRSLPDLVQ